MNRISWRLMDDTRLLDEELKTEEKNYFPYEIPSKVTDKKFISIPAVDKVVESDEEWEKCGKWLIIFCGVGSKLQDTAWIKLERLVEDGTLLMVKSSTVNTRDKHGAILCYTHPETSKIKMAAEAIQGRIDIPYSMCYMKNESTKHKRKTLSCVCEKYAYNYQYLYTPTGKLYQTDDHQRWILMTEDEIQKETAKSENYNFASNESENTLYSKMKLENSPDLNVSDFMDSTSGYWFVRCDISVQDENGMSELERIAKATKELFGEIVFPEIKETTIDKSSMVFKFNIRKHDDIRDIIEYPTKLRKSVFFTHPMYFHKYNSSGLPVCKFMHTSENEVFENVFVKYFCAVPLWKTVSLELLDASL